MCTKIYFIKSVLSKTRVNIVAIFAHACIFPSQSTSMIIANDEKIPSRFTHSRNFGKCLQRYCAFSSWIVWMCSLHIPFDTCRKFYSTEIHDRILILIAFDEQVCYRYPQRLVLACYLQVLWNECLIDDPNIIFLCNFRAVQ